MARAYLAAPDVFVFPSRTEDLRLVLLEAMASGVPVAAYPVPGPSDVVIQNRTGVLHDDLQRATLEALKLGGEESPTPAVTRGDAPRRRSPP